MSEATGATIDHKDVNFFDPAIQDCPYPAYELLRNEAPIYKDPITGAFVVTRYEDLRAILLDTVNFVNGANANRRRMGQQSDRAKRMMELYETKGWLPAPTLAGRDDPNHKQMRAMFDRAFRPGKIKGIDPLVEATSQKLFDAFIEDGHCDWVKQFAVPLPLIIIGKQMGVPEADIWKIKAWTDAWVQRLGGMQTEEQERWSVEMEIEAQHYFQAIFDRLRVEPDETLLSDIVNYEIPEWGRKLNDNELHAEMMADTFVGGSETSTNALSAGVQLLIENPDAWAQLKSDPEKYVRPLVEEVLRLESPVQGLFRTTANDVTVNGVDIPAHSMINVRYASANRDERQFECPEKLDLDRGNTHTHLAFGSGTHHCLGAPLARRELFYGFKTLVERIDEMWFAPGKNDFKHQPNIALRALQELHIEFKKA